MVRMVIVAMIIVPSGYVKIAIFQVAQLNVREFSDENRMVIFHRYVSICQLFLGWSPMSRSASGGNSDDDFAWLPPVPAFDGRTFPWCNRFGTFWNSRVVNYLEWHPDHPFFSLTRQVAKGPRSGNKWHKWCGLSRSLLKCWTTSRFIPVRFALGVKETRFINTNTLR